MATSPAGRMLSRQLQQMQSDKDIPGISCGLVDNNVFEWEVMLMISDDVKLYGGMAGPYPGVDNVPDTQPVGEEHRPSERISVDASLRHGEKLLML